MFIWDLLTVFTDVMDDIFGLLTGVLSLLATIAALNERLLLFVIDFFRTSTDAVYNIGEYLDNSITCWLSPKDVFRSVFETVREIHNNIFDVLCLTALPVGVSLAFALTIFLAIHRRRWIPDLNFFLPHFLRIRQNHNFIAGDLDDGGEADWNANENAILNYDDVRDFRERDSSSNSDDEDAHSSLSEHYLQVHNRGAGACRGSNSNSNVDKLHHSLRSEEDRLLCVVCQDKNKSVLVLPCRHLCMCMACAKVISCDAELPKICPLCRTAISRLVNVYV